MNKKPSLKQRRAELLDLLAANGISETVCEAFAAVPQETMFDPIFGERLYTRERVPVGCGEKSDDPLLLARMIDYLQLRNKDRVLEVGTGSGYSTAVLSLLCREVWTIDCREELAQSAKRRLYSKGYENIRFYCGDATDPDNGFEGLDAVLCLAACRKRPLTLMQSLKDGGTIVFPMGPETGQQIIVMRNEFNPANGERFMVQYRETDNFSPITGRYGYDVPELDPEYLAFLEENIAPEDE